MLEQTEEPLRLYICKSLNTTFEKMQQDVKKLQEWTKTQPHLPQCATPTILTTFLINTKNDMDQAKQKIDNYYSSRVKIPALYASRDPFEESIQNVNKELYLYYLPKVTPDGCRVLMGKLATGNIRDFDMVSVLRKGLMVQDVYLHREAFTRGQYIAFDADNVSLLHSTKLTPSVCRDIIYCMQGVFPINIKGFIIFNAPSAVFLIMSLLKSVMKKKLRKRVHIFTEGPEALEQFFPIEMLAKDYGGDEDTCENLNDEWFACLKRNKEWLMNEGSVTTDEKKRIHTKSQQETYKVDAKIEKLKNFKNLNID